METHTDMVGGLSGLDLKGQTIPLGRGIELRPTFAHVFTTDILAFARPETPTSYHPGPWQAASHKTGTDITAELFIPGPVNVVSIQGRRTALTIVSLLRLWVDPRIALHLACDCPIVQLKDRLHDATAAPQHVASLMPNRERFVEIGLIDESKIIESISWVVTHWEDAVSLRSVPEFDFAVETFDNAQAIPSPAMMLVSLWGALEAIFSSTSAELRFRASSQIAAFLCPRGKQRQDKQRGVAKLYDLRSAAAHGKPKQGYEDVVATFVLLRDVLIRMIENKAVPTKERLEELLFA